MSKIEKTNSCWIWKGYVNPDGYGRYSSNYKTFFAHRYSWIIHKGNIPNAILVCHSCDNRKCVNPEHLFLGTHKDNYQDSKNKKRHVHGNSHGQTKIKEEFHEEIINSYLSGETQRNIAKKYSVSQGAIQDIIRKKIPAKILKGETANGSIFNENQIKEIRSMYVPGKVTFLQIAKIYQVNPETIRRIIRRERWAHV